MTQPSMVYRPPMRTRDLLAAAKAALESSREHKALALEIRSRIETIDYFGADKADLDRDFQEAHALLTHVVGKGYRAPNDHVAIPRDLWNRIEAWVKAHEPKPKLTAEDIVRRVHAQFSPHGAPVNLPEDLHDAIVEWAKDNPPDGKD